MDKWTEAALQSTNSGMLDEEKLQHIADYCDRRVTDGTDTASYAEIGAGVKAALGSLQPDQQSA